MIQKIKLFRGIGIEIIGIAANEFDGYGLSILQVTISYKGEVCTISKSASLFTINFMPVFKNGGKKIDMFFGILFTSYTVCSITVVPEKDRCVTCGDVCETKEFYINQVPFCNSYCQEI